MLDREAFVRTADESRKHAKECRRLDIFDAIYNKCTVGEQKLSADITDEDLRKELESLGYSVKFLQETKYNIYW